MANMIENTIVVHIKSKKEKLPDKYLYEGHKNGLSDILKNLEKEKEFEETILYDFEYEFQEDRYILTFQSKKTEIKELADKISRYSNYVRAVEYHFLDNDGQDYGGKYYYLAGTVKKFEFDTDYFTDLNSWLDTDENEPDLEEYFWTEDRKYINKLEISLNDEPEKLLGYLDHLKNEGKLSYGDENKEPLLYDFSYYYNSEKKSVGIEFYSFDFECRVLSSVIYEGVNSVIKVWHYLYVWLKFGYVIVYEDNILSIYDLDTDFFDELSYAENAREKDAANKKLKEPKNCEFLSLSEERKMDT